MTIKYVFSDIDGVLVGTKKGINFPQPHHQTIQTLINLHRKRVGFSLLTAKATFSILPLIKHFPFNYYHSGDNGATIINGQNLSVSLIDYLDSNLIKQLFPHVLNFCGELYTISNWYVINNNPRYQNIIQRHQDILETSPQLFKLTDLNKLKIIRLSLIASNQQEITIIEQALNNFKDKINIKWLINPYMPQTSFAIVTPKNISKKNIVIKIMANNNLNPEECLAIGDSNSDYEFMSLCQYQATLDNGQMNLKINIKKNNGYISHLSVDDGGFLDIVKNYFVYEI